MIWAMMKKQGLLLWRNQSQILLLIGLPILLIAILGFSLSGFMGGDGITSFHVNVALLEHESEEEQVDRFIQALEEYDLSSEEMGAMTQQASALAPIHVMKQEVFEPLKGTLDVKQINASERDEILQSNEYAALIEVPEDFTFRMLEHMLLDENKAVPTLNVFQNEDIHLEAQIAMDIIEIFQEQWALSRFVDEIGADPTVLNIPESYIRRDIQSISRADPITAQSYYAIGMAVMNILFMATTIAAWAYFEKESHIFNRLIISRTSQRQYVFGIFVTGTTYAFAQLLIIYGLSALFYKIYWPNIGLFMLISCTLAVTVGSLAAFLSSISYRLNSHAITSLFGSFIIYIFAFLGGSFFPIGELSSTIRKLGNFTPNGAGMTAYLTIMRGGSLEDIQSYAIALAMSASVLLIVALIVFPKRGVHV